MKMIERRHLDPDDIDQIVAKAKSEYEIVNRINSEIFVDYFDFEEKAIWTNSKGD